MINATKKIVSGILITTIIMSNCIFIYADDKNSTNKIVIIDIKNIKDNKAKKDKSDFEKLNFLRMQNLCLNESIFEEDKNKYSVDLKDEEDNDNDDTDLTLDLINMDINEYKNELKNGEDLRSLLKKYDAESKFDNIAYKKYKKILENAVNNNAITFYEMEELLEKYSENMNSISA